MNSLKFTFVILLGSLLFSCSKINSVSIDSPPESIYKGDSVQLKAIVKGEGSPDTTVNWVILEPVAKGTTISKDGKLFVDQSEKSPSIKVKAISILDTSKSSLVSIKVNVDLKYFLGNWNIKLNNVPGKLVLTNDLCVLKFNGGYSYNIKDLKWTAIKNDDIATKDEYPDGYIITGTADKVNRYNIILGEMLRYKLLINNDNSKILRIDMKTEKGRFIDMIFTRDNQ